MRFSPIAHIPSGKVVMPHAQHLVLANHFQRLANAHRLLAGMNSPDPTQARLPRPDKTALDVRSGAPLFRQPVIGVPNSPMPQGF
jgi:hypothetical protein